MAHDMTDNERRAFLLAGTRTGKVAVALADGSPHVSPVWFVLDGDTVVFTTWHESLKYKALRRDPRIGFSVDEETFPYAFVIMRGTTELVDDPGERLRWSTQISRRYVPADQVDAFGKRNAVDGEWLVRFTPTRTIAQTGIAD